MSGRILKVIEFPINNCFFKVLAELSDTEYFETNLKKRGFFHRWMVGP